MKVKSFLLNLILSIGVNKCMGFFKIYCILIVMLFYSGFSRSWEMSANIQFDDSSGGDHYRIDWQISNWVLIGLFRNPCYRQSSCWIGLRVIDQSAPFKDLAVGSYNINSTWLASNNPGILTELEFSGLGDYMNNKFGMQSGSLTVPAAIFDSLSVRPCLGYVYGNSRSLGPVREVAPYGAECIFLNKPVIPAKCEFSNTSLILDHGKLSPQSIQGNQRTGSISVKCNKKATVKFKMSSLDTASRLWIKYNSLYSVLKINGRPGYTGIQTSVDNYWVSIPISSTLGSLSNVSSGSYNASTVLMMDFQ